MQLRRRSDFSLPLAAHPFHRIQPAVIKLLAMGLVHARFKALLAMPVAGDFFQTGEQPQLQPGQISGVPRPTPTA